jgi:hypothetical protein
MGGVLTGKEGSCQRQILPGATAGQIGIAILRTRTSLEKISSGTIFAVHHSDES